MTGQFDSNCAHYNGYERGGLHSCDWSYVTAKWGSLTDLSPPGRPGSAVTKQDNQRRHTPTKNTLKGEQYSSGLIWKYLEHIHYQEKTSCYSSKRFFFHFRSFNVTLVKSEVNNDLFDGALEFVHVALEEREVGEEEVLEAAVLLRVGRQHEDDPDGDLLLAGHAEARPTALI